MADAAFKEVPRKDKGLNIKARSWVGRMLDGAIDGVAPRWSLRRYEARIRRHLAGTMYRAASTNRLFENWTTGAEGETELSWELPRIRARSRKLIRDSDIAEGLILTLVTKIIGPGLAPQALVDSAAVDIEDDLRMAWEEDAERLWRRWTPYADASGKLPFWRMQRLALRSMLIDGDVFWLRQWVTPKTRPLEMGWKLVPADRVATPLDKSSDKTIRNGIKFYASGRPAGYYIKEGSSRSGRYVPATDSAGRPNVIHQMIPGEIDRSRGVPILAAALPRFHDLSAYIESTLVRARVEACISAFVKKAGPASGIVGRTEDTDSDDRRIEELSPGIIEYLQPGEEINFLSPQTPGNNFEDLVKRLLRGIGSSVGLSYEFAAKDYSHSNYSNTRMAALDVRDVFEDLRHLISEGVCQPIWELVIEEGVLKGLLGDYGYFANPWAWTRSRWTGRGWPSVDPAKEAAADRGRLGLGTTTLSHLCADRGLDWEEVLQQLAREKAKREELGLPEPILTRSGV